MNLNKNFSAKFCQTVLKSDKKIGYYNKNSNQLGNFRTTLLQH